MSNFGLHIADIFVLGLYLIGVTIIGVWAARRVKNIADFFEDNLSDDVMVMTEAIHSCMVARGVRNPFSTSIFLEARGLYRTQEGPRIEFFNAISSSHFNSGR